MRDEMTERQRIAGDALKIANEAMYAANLEAVESITGLKHGQHVSWKAYEGIVDHKIEDRYVMNYISDSGYITLFKASGELGMNRRYVKFSECKAVNK